jgi:hypothetical protein
MRARPELWRLTARPSEMRTDAKKGDICIFRSSQLPKLPGHAADHVGGACKKPLIVPRHTGRFQLTVDRELNGACQRKHGHKRAHLKREATLELDHSLLNMLAATDFCEFTRTANVEISSPACRLGHYLLQKVKMEGKTLLNECSEKLKQMTELIQQASKRLSQGADVEELCEEARKLAENWDHSVKETETSAVAANAISRHSSGGME